MMRYESVRADVFREIALAATTGKPTTDDNEVNDEILGT